MYSRLCADITLQVPRFVSITMSTKMRRSEESTEDHEDTSQESCSQMFSFPGDGGLDVKRKYDEDMKELEQYRRASKKGGEENRR
jgi:hypothetical protein